MLIDKLFDGVLELDTAIGPRYIKLTFAQRAYMIWTFRNFFSLPQQVLRPRERRLIDRLWSEQRFVPVPTTGAPADFIIGRVERRAAHPAEVVSIASVPVRSSSIRKPVAGTKATPAIEPTREAASA